MAMSRRTLIKTGIAGGVLLSTAGLATRGTLWGKGSRRAEIDGYRYAVLTMNDRQAMQAIAPVILAGALVPLGERVPPDLTEEVVRGFDQAVSGLLPEVQKEIRQLLSLLSLAPTRATVAGVWSSWQKAEPQKIDKFLNGWRHSKLSLLRTAYDALQQLTLAAWYGNPKSWAGIGYPGPPKLV